MPKNFMWMRSGWALLGLLASCSQPGDGDGLTPTQQNSLNAQSEQNSQNIQNTQNSESSQNATASLVSVANSRVLRSVIVTGTEYELPDPNGGLIVEVRDSAGVALSDVAVILDLSGCTYVTLCSMTPGLDCRARIVTGVSGPDGTARLPVGGKLAGANLGRSGGECARLTVGGIPFPNQVVSVMDLDASGNVGGGDLSAFLSDFASGEYRPRADFDGWRNQKGELSIGGGDLSAWLSGFASSYVSACSETCAAVCGNGIQETGELCDGQPCCTANCTFKAAGELCDPWEGTTCSGTVGSCATQGLPSGVQYYNPGTSCQ